MQRTKTKSKMISKTPFVSICTPTFNRRPFIPFLIKCFEHQIYPRDKMEWIIIDDGTDHIEDLVKHIPQIKYFKYDKKMTLGKKRNLMHNKSSGEIIVYMDDDDYYPPERVSHAVEMLQHNPHALCAGTSEMHIYFKHIQKMYKFGPYGPNHTTAATMAFRRELLSQTKYDDNACLAEEKHFLKNYTIPFVQLEPTKSILVISHIHNSFDKKQVLDQPNEFVNESSKTIDDFIKEPELFQFFINDVDLLLDSYDLGLPHHKQDVVKQTEKIKEDREKMMRDHQTSVFLKMELQMQEKMKEYAEQLKNHYDKIIDDKTTLINAVLKRNKELIDKNELYKKQLDYFESNIEYVNVEYLKK
jgi:glycosyltransferase involved in cell wall biosynthesis